MSGIQGYSTPTPEHVLFSVSEKHLDFFTMVMQAVLPTGSVIELLGAYKGKAEPSFCVTRAVFDDIHSTWAFLFEDQESVLVLGTPQARNWRPATLVYLHRNIKVDLGMWRSATREEAVAARNYTHDVKRNLYWICEVDPPANEWERQERAKKAAVEKAVSFLNRLTLPHEEHMRMLEVRDALVQNFWGK